MLFSFLIKQETNTGLLHRWRSRNRRQLQLKKVGVSTFDEIFKVRCIFHQINLFSTFLISFFLD